MKVLDCINIKEAAISCFFFLCSCTAADHKWEASEYYEDGAPREEVLYFDEGKEDSTFLLRKLYNSGSVMSTFTYVEGVQVGKALGYYESGSVGLLVHYNNDIRDGLEMRWTEDGFLRSRFMYSEGKRTEGCFYYENGQPTGDLKFDSLGLISEGTYFHENGNLRSRGAFLKRTDGVKHGQWERFHENGILKEIGKYDSGERVGSWLFYDSLGVETMNVNYTYDD